MKYDKRSIQSSLNYLAKKFGVRVETLEKRGKRGGVTRYWMMTGGNDGIKFLFKLNDIKALIKSMEAAAA